jgi:putative ABC transport system permease protein
VGVTPIDSFAGVPRAETGELLSVAKAQRFRGGWVTFAETMKVALDSLRAHKLRSFLTLLGVILAVATLVSVMSVIAGLNLYIAEKVANLGANVLLIDRFGIITSHDAWTRAQRRPILTLEDLDRYRATAKIPKEIAAVAQAQTQTRSGSAVLDNTSILGATANYFAVRDLNIAQGRFPTQADDDQRTEVAFIGADVADKFFPSVDPVGKTIRADTHTYEVVGVGARIGSVMGRPMDNYVILPLGTYMKGWHKPTDTIWIFAQAPNSEQLQATEDEARLLFRAWHHLPYNAPDDFAILGSQSIMEVWHSLTGNLAQVATALVSVFLVVGGIVIMNIMLASVTERTREIGLRRSLGARRQHILFQFLAESATLAAVGGIIGILIAGAIVLVVKNAFDFPMAMPVSAVVLSLLLSTAVGLFFGIFPASRAAKLDPIEALRQEV